MSANQTGSVTGLQENNSGISKHFKTWVDVVISDPRMAAGAQPVLAGKPAVLVTVRGGNYRPGTPREGWDHATGWMRRILGDVWNLDPEVVETEFTNVGVWEVASRPLSILPSPRYCRMIAKIEHVYGV
jgi:flavodoxin-like protein